MSKLYKSFRAAPQFVFSPDGELLDKTKTLTDLARDVCDISAEATFVVRNDEKLLEQLNSVTQYKPAEAGRVLGISLSEKRRGTGESRKEKLFQHNAISSARGWNERIRAAENRSGKYLSAGWKRTANAGKPTYGEDFVNLGAVDGQYAKIFVTDSTLDLHLVVNRQWVVFPFNFDFERFKGFSKVCLPIISLKNGVPIFDFPVEFPEIKSAFSSDYIVGVDVGKVQYATVVVYNTKTRKKVYSSTLSQRVHSLWNSIQASERQVKNLRKKAEKHPLKRQLVMGCLNEAELHRAKNVRKKQELAILAAQEIAEISAIFHNAPVAFEDLSWIKNTMKNGRWNRGDLFTWTSHYLSQNGGWVLKVSAYKTSQICHICHEQGFLNNRVFTCPTHGSFDRDINAGANIAQNAEKSVVKAIATRSKSKKLTPLVQRTPKTRNSLRHPGRDRTKNAPTPKRRKHIFIRKRIKVESSTYPATGVFARVVADVVIPMCTDNGTLVSGMNIENDYRT